jgi:hypothetical protein
MITVSGTYFTKEQLEAALKGNVYFYFLYSDYKYTNELVFTADNVFGGGYSGSDKLNYYGFEYKNEKKQYDKALA